MTEQLYIMLEMHRVMELLMYKMKSEANINNKNSSFDHIQEYLDGIKNDIEKLRQRPPQ
jgi:hypothetical protein